MSPTALAKLQHAERVAQKWSRDSYWTCLRSGMTPARAAYYSDRRVCWGDALTLVRTYGELIR